MNKYRHILALNALALAMTLTLAFSDAYIESVEHQTCVLAAWAERAGVQP